MYLEHCHDSHSPHISEEKLTQLQPTNYEQSATASCDHAAVLPGHKSRYTMYVAYRI